MKSGFVSILLLAAAGSAMAAAERPNIILIVADDLGYSGVSCQGGDLATPAIDSLARSGIRFTNGYVSCPVCSPTRAGLNTGRYQQRFGYEFNPGPEGNASPTFGLPLSEATMAARLKAAGYTTGAVGKWHLGHEKQFLPPNRGFDEFFGFPGGAHDYFKPGQGNNLILRGLKPVQEQEYLTDALSREAVTFVSKHAGESKPFYLYLAYNAVHTPMQAPEKYLNRFTSISDKNRRTHAAMLAAMDDGIGQVLNAVSKAGIEDKTLVFFISDNGAPTLSNTSSNKPLRGYKGQVLEGGIRVPFIVRWKGQIPEGKTCDKPVISLDIMPTAVAAAGGKMPTNWPIDGVNLLPYLTGKDQGAPHETLFWRMGPQAAVRKGDWKLIRVAAETAAKEGQAPAAAPPPRGRRAARRAADTGVGGVGKPGSVMLYNLARDIHEDNNLADENPEKVKELAAALDAWEAQLAKPLWFGRAKFQSDAASQPAEKGKAKEGNRAGRGKRARQQ